MLQSRFFALATAALLASAAHAQQFCSDNLYHCYLVGSSGTPAPSSVDPTGVTVYSFADEQVFLAIDPTLPTGTYYVHLIDAVNDGLDEVLSTNDPLDRFVNVTNTNGVITLSLPYSNNQEPSLFGVGLNGQGQSLRLHFRESVFTPCRYAVVMGNWWDLTNGPESPYLLIGGINPTTGACAVRSYSGFRLGNGQGSDVVGSVFSDANRNGARGSGEGGLAGWQVRLVTGSTSVTTTTAADGSYRFDDVPAGSYSVELVLGSGHIATTAASFAVQVCDCAEVTVQAFGAAPAILPANARPVCYWIGYHGSQRAQQYGVLATLPALHLVNTCGQYVAPGHMLHFRAWLLLNNSWNMGYELAAELAAMHCNVVTGYVHPDSVLRDPLLGTMTVGALMQQAIGSLAAHPYTPTWSPHRATQSRLRNALLRANYNLIWQ